MGLIAAVTLGLPLLVVFGPRELGGASSYIVISGNSMEPTYHRGDLVIVRERAEYHEGDIVVYRHPLIGRVIHRVIGREGSRYVLQGDNNKFVDAFRPGAGDTIGEAVVHVPQVGGLLVRWRSACVLVSVLVLGAGLVGPGRTHLRSAAHTGRRRAARRRARASVGRAGQEGATWTP